MLPRLVFFMAMSGFLINHESLHTLIGWPYWFSGTIIHRVILFGNIVNEIHSLIISSHFSLHLTQTCIVKSCSFPPKQNRSANHQNHHIHTSTSMESSAKVKELSKIFLDSNAGGLEHRINLVKFWGITPGSRVLEIGCGQGDCTTVLADAVGPDGHVDAVDPGAPDYGSYPSLHKSSFEKRNRSPNHLQLLSFKHSNLC